MVFECGSQLYVIQAGSEPRRAAGQEESNRTAQSSQESSGACPYQRLLYQRQRRFDQVSLLDERKCRESADG